MTDVRYVIVGRKTSPIRKDDFSYFEESFATDFPFETAHDVVAVNDWKTGEFLYWTYTGKTNLVFRDTGGRIHHVYPQDQIKLDMR